MDLHLALTIISINAFSVEFPFYICTFLNNCYLVTEDYQQLIEDIVRDGRLYASENHQDILKVCFPLSARHCKANAQILFPVKAC